MKIKLINGGVVLIDKKDFVRLCKYKWYLYKTHNKETIYQYAIRYTPANYGQKHIMMHREIMCLNDKNLLVDHIHIFQRAKKR